MGLKYSAKHVVNRCVIMLGSAVSFIEHRQSRFSIILEDPRIFGMVNEHWL